MDNEETTLAPSTASSSKKQNGPVSKPTPVTSTKPSALSIDNGGSSTQAAVRALVEAEAPAQPKSLVLDAFAQFRAVIQTRDQSVAEASAEAEPLAHVENEVQGPLALERFNRGAEEMKKRKAATNNRGDQDGDPSSSNTKNNSKGKANKNDCQNNNDNGRNEDQDASRNDIKGKAIENENDDEATEKDGPPPTDPKGKGKATDDNGNDEEVHSSASPETVRPHARAPITLTNGHQSPWEALNDPFALTPAQHAEINDYIAAQYNREQDATTPSNGENDTLPANPMPSDWHLNYNPLDILDDNAVDCDQESLEEISLVIRGIFPRPPNDRIGEGRLPAGRSFASNLVLRFSQLTELLPDPFDEPAMPLRNGIAREPFPEQMQAYHEPSSLRQGVASAPTAAATTRIGSFVNPNPNSPFSASHASTQSCARSGQRPTKSGPSNRGNSKAPADAPTGPKKWREDKARQNNRSFNPRYPSETQGESSHAESHTQRQGAPQPIPHLNPHIQGEGQGDSSRVGNHAIQVQREESKENKPKAAKSKDWCKDREFKKMEEKKDDPDDPNNTMAFLGIS
ncbi:uncharacterized protein PAC_17292 [Phialocephala subalpina]|uniref:Uncharacterized protein n=1 Tax=Phialocephala subalpina TaxID=576137 RepID=A0A1L7XQS2_9HELO|nr:uncharacterized protein PAC_17292 [Phialocephala subalpina]